jgi:hypothetical protein
MATAENKIIRSSLMRGIKAQPTQQYVSGGTLLTGGQLGPRVLPEAIDTVERQLGHRVYDRMVTDPDVHAGLEVLVLSALAEGLQFTPNIKDDQVDGHEESVKWADFVTRAFNRIPHFRAKLQTVVTEGLSHGNKVAEWVLEYPAQGEDQGKLTLCDVKPKPREVVGFVLNEFSDLLGLTVVRPGQTWTTFQGSVINDLSQVLPTEKFLIFTPIPRNNDPRGVSYIRAAYEAWWLKQQTFPEFLRFLLQCAIESLLGFLPPDAEDVEVVDQETGLPELDAQGKPKTMPAAQDMLANLVSLRNAQAAVFSDGSKVQQVEVHSDGEVFHKAFQFYGRQITLAILKQELATRDAAHQTKGSTGNQQTILDLVVVSLKGIICDTLRTGIVRTLVRLNGGDAAAEAYLPEVSAGSERRDWATDASALVALGPSLTDSQWIQGTTELGFKTPEENEVLPVRVKGAVPAADPLANPTQPDGGGPPDQGQPPSANPVKPAPRGMKRTPGGALTRDRKKEGANAD